MKLRIVHLISLPFIITIFALALHGKARGPLRVFPTNPRYFEDGTGKPVYLAGSHNWNNFVDTGHRLAAFDDPPPQFDYSAYLDFLQLHHHNLFRLWRWELPKWQDEDPPGIKYAMPHPWVRSGPGDANDGKPKFDLTRYDDSYFQRMRDRIIMAQDRGIYVSVMLFEGWCVQLRDDVWKYHPFHPANNVNGIEADSNGDGRGIEFYTLHPDAMGNKVLELQESYVRKVIDAVNDLDNVLYEICNEAGVYSNEWQYHMIRLVQSYEAKLPKRHPVGMTFAYKGGSNKELLASPADWISPNEGQQPDSYKDNPPSKYAGKVIVSDTDHLWGHTAGDIIWVWKSFLRGLNVLFMEELSPSPTWQDSAREGMRQTRLWSEKIDLAHMAPDEKSASSKYCLANPGREYLAFAPNSAAITMRLKDAPGTFAAEWFNVNEAKSVPAPRVRGGRSVILNPPFSGPAVIYLKLETLK